MSIDFEHIRPLNTTIFQKKKNSKLFGLSVHDVFHHDAVNIKLEVAKTSYT